jgi:hypothetical protein
MASRGRGEMTASSKSLNMQRDLEHSRNYSQPLRQRERMEMSTNLRTSLTTEESFATREIQALNLSNEAMTQSSVATRALQAFDLSNQAMAQSSLLYQSPHQLIPPPEYLPVSTLLAPGMRQTNAISLGTMNYFGEFNSAATLHMHAQSRLSSLNALRDRGMGHRRNLPNSLLMEDYLHRDLSKTGNRLDSFHSLPPNHHPPALRSGNYGDSLIDQFLPNLNKRLLQQVTDVAIYSRDDFLKAAVLLDLDRPAKRVKSVLSSANEFKHKLSTTEVKNIR